MTDTDARLLRMANLLRRQREVIADRHERAARAAKDAPANQCKAKAQKAARKALHARMRVELGMVE